MKNLNCAFQLKLLRVLILAASLSCREKATKETNTVIDFSKAVEEDLNSSEIIKSINFIPLEFREDCVISEITKIVLYNDTLYILSNDELYLFNLQGKFIKKFGKQGKGPGEYLSAMDFTIDRTNQRVIINDFIQSKIQIYNTNGKFISNFDVGRMWALQITNNGLFVGYPINIFGNQKYSMVILNNMGDTLHTFPNSFTFNLNGNPFAIPANSPFYNMGKQVCFHQFLSDTLFCFNESETKLEPRFIFSNANTLPVELLGNSSEFSKKEKNYSWIQRVLETENYLFLDFHSSGNNKKLLFDKVENILREIRWTPRGETLTKPLETSAFFWPDFTFSDNEIIKIWPALFFKKYFKKVSTDKESILTLQKFGIDDFSKMYGQVQENDNPVLMLVKLKE